MWKFDGSRIKVARDTKDVTRPQLAERLNVSTQQLTQWETGKIKPGQDSLVNVCNVLDIHPRFFFVEVVPNVHDEEKKAA